MHLPIVLIFLVVMMLLGVTVIRNVTLGEKMAGNLRNQQLAFQAAEKALRYCENAAQGVIPAGGPTPTIAPAPVTADWADGSAVSIAIPRPLDTDNNPTDGLAATPRCMVEDFAGNLAPDMNQTKVDESVKAYRVTARGVGGTQNAVVLLQSYLRFN